MGGIVSTNAFTVYLPSEDEIHSFSLEAPTVRIH